MPSAPIPAGSARPATQERAALSSITLLDGRPSVIIDHDGEHYVLRATRAGKLILTK